MIKTLERHGDSVLGVSFSHDGKWLASASKDGTMILWNLDLEDLLARGCSWLHDYLQSNHEMQSIDPTKPSDSRALCNRIK